MTSQMGRKYCSSRHPGRKVNPSKWGEVNRNQKYQRQQQFGRCFSRHLLALTFLLEFHKYLISGHQTLVRQGIRFAEAVSGSAEYLADGEGDGDGGVGGACHHSLAKKTSLKS